MKAGIFVTLGLMLASPALAQATRQQPTTYEPSSLLAHAARIERDATQDLKANPQGFGWFVDLDMYISNDKAEYEALAKYVLLVFSAFSNDPAELPLAKMSAGGVALKCSQGRRYDLPADSATAKAYGNFRADSLCVLPMPVERKTNALTVDFAKSRTGLQISPVPFEEPDFVKADSDPISLPSPDPLILQKILTREYPGFGFGVPT
jgi:hypothetical protein